MIPDGFRLSQETAFAFTVHVISRGGVVHLGHHANGEWTVLVAPPHKIVARVVRGEILPSPSIVRYEVP